MSSKTVLSKLIAIPIAVAIIVVQVFCVGCGSRPSEEVYVWSDTPLDAKARALQGAGSDLDATELWCRMSDSIGRHPGPDVREWLTLQQFILTNDVGPYWVVGLRHSSIQEFGRHLDSVGPYHEWLMQCQTNGAFKDPFVMQNIDMILADWVKMTNRYSKRTWLPPTTDKTPE